MLHRLHSLRAEIAQIEWGDNVDQNQWLWMSEHKMKVELLHQLAQKERAIKEAEHVQVDLVINVSFRPFKVRLTRNYA